MNNKIKNYVEVLFAHVPQSKKANELKEELLSNMSERFEDYIKEGKTEDQAYGLVIANLGDVDKMIADVMPNAEFIEQANYFRTRNAAYIAISISMYIIAAALLIGIVGFGISLGNSGTYTATGLLVSLLISAVATGIIIYSSMSTPLEYKNYNKKTKTKVQKLDKKHNKLWNNIMSTYWTMMAFIYLAISFITGLWGITWIIWILASVVYSILKSILGIKSNHIK